MSLLVLTDRRQAPRPLVDVVTRALHGGARRVVLREKDLPDEQRLALAMRLQAMLAEVGGTLLVAGQLTGWAGGVHLSAAGRFLTPKPPLVGRSCHDVTELTAAAAQDTDYVTVSPVFPTASKPGYGPPLGLTGLAELCAATRLPVYALGGITTRDDVLACRRAGAAGVAVMGAIMRASDPAAKVEELLS